MIENCQSDQKDKADGQAPANQFFLDRQQRLDGNSGGFGQFRGLPYWNMNLGIKKNLRVTERFNVEGSVNFVNVLNHNQLLDPTLNIAGQNPQTFGQLSTEGTLPRAMEFGIRVSF